MILKVINSGSSGNCYILIANNGDCLILEAGVRLLDVKEALKFDISGIVGCCSTHCHLDHSEYLLQYAKSSIKCYSGEETINKFEKHHNLIAIKPNVKIQLGSFSTMPFLLHHDVENYGYIINHPESGLIVFITDTLFCKYVFPDNVRHWIIEANMDLEIIDSKSGKSRIPDFITKRVEESHMSIETCKSLLKSNDLTKTINIVLVHLSESNSNEKVFKRIIEEATGKPTVCAEKGMCINFDKSPF